nr:ABC transporter G family member 36-like [Ipomoea batatas]
MAAGIFRLTAAVCRTMIIANTGGALSLLLVFLLGGFIRPKKAIPDWWGWGYWVSPLSYGFNAFTVNEMFAPRWMNELAADKQTKLGIQVMKNFDVFVEKRWFWIGAAALLGFIFLFNILFTLALMYLSPPGQKQAIISKDQAKDMEAEQEESSQSPRLKTTRSKRDALPRSLSAHDGNNTRELEFRRMSSRSNKNGLSRNDDANLDSTNGVAPKRGMILPFTPLAMSFDEVKYFVDMPPAWNFDMVVESDVGNVTIYRRNKALVKELSTPPPGANDLYFHTQHSQSTWGQFKSCLWKQWWTYWRSPDYNLVRYFFTLAAALMIGTIFWDVGSKRGFPNGGYGTTGFAPWHGPYMAASCLNMAMSKAPFEIRGILLGISILRSKITSKIILGMIQISWELLLQFWLVLQCSLHSCMPTASKH